MPPRADDDDDVLLGAMTDTMAHMVDGVQKGTYTEYNREDGLTELAKHLALLGTQVIYICRYSKAKENLKRGALLFGQVQGWVPGAGAVVYFSPSSSG